MDAFGFNAWGIIINGSAFAIHRYVGCKRTLISVRNLTFSSFNYARYHSFEKFTSDTCEVFNYYACGTITPGRGSFLIGSSRSIGHSYLFISVHFSSVPSDRNFMCVEQTV